MKYCSNCGQVLSPKTKFCGKCGSKVGSSGVSKRLSSLQQEQDESALSRYKQTFSKYIEFSGRANRREYWTFFFGNLIIGMILGFIEGALGFYSETTDSVFGGIFQLIVLLPAISVGVRRMHDVGKSGWYLLFPVLNLIYVLQHGERGENQYGEDPSIE